MADAPKLAFAPFAAPARGVLVVFCDDGLKFGPATRKALGAAGRSGAARAAKAERFTGKSGIGARHLIAPAGLKVARLAGGLGAGKTARAQVPQDFVKLGGAAMGKVPVGAERGDDVRRTAGRRAEGRAGGRSRARRAAARLCVRPLQDQAQGGRGAAGQAQRDDRGRRRRRGAARPMRTREAIADGVLMARDLVNEPANVLYPEEFARRAPAL